MMLLWLLISQLASADGKKIYSLRASEYDGHFQVTVMDAPECIATIHDILYPDTDIKKGLSALLDFSHPSAASCLDETLDLWPKEVGLPEYVKPKEEKDLPDGWDELYLPEWKKLNAVQQCYIADKPGTYYYENKKSQILEHCGKISTKQEIDEADKAYQAKQLDAQKWENLAERVKNLYVPYPYYDHKKADALSEKVSDCSPKYTKDWDDKKTLWLCGKDTLSQDKYESLTKLYKQEQDKVDKIQDQWNQANDQMQVNLTKLLLRVPGLKEQLLPLYPDELCVNPHEEKSDKFITTAEDRADQCKGKWQSPEPLRKKIKALLGSREQISAKVAEQERVFHEALTREAARLNTGRNFSYATRSLLLRYQSFLAHGGKPEGLASFCSENQKQMERDYQLSKFSSELDFVSYSEDSRYPAIAKQHGLSEGELSAIFSFTNNYYKKINPALLKGKLDAELQTYRGLLDSALAKLPAYTAGPVKRFVDFPEKILAEHKVGKVVCYKSFSSTSKDVDWSWDGKQELLIYPGAKGKDVSEISNHESEQEVLFAANSCFKVLAKKKDADGYERTRFIMAEVDKNGKVIAKLPKKLEQP